MNLDRVGVCLSSESTGKFGAPANIPYFSGLSTLRSSWKGFRCYMIFSIKQIRSVFLFIHFIILGKNIVFVRYNEWVWLCFYPRILKESWRAIMIVCGVRCCRWRRQNYTLPRAFASAALIFIKYLCQLFFFLWMYTIVEERQGNKLISQIPAMLALWLDRSWGHFGFSWIFREAALTI